MNELIDDPLQYSRLERRAVASGTVNLCALIEAILAERADEIRKRGVKVTLKIPLESITADAEGLTQALRNLIDNAIKFTVNIPEPFIEIVDRATEKECIIEVHDNGLGFDMQYKERIFEIFQRLHRAEEYPGTGVGLAIVRKAMERMGGHGRRALPAKAPLSIWRYRNEP
jgi:light-regulated signal transduction histidine kinase (bacteriophytochrome)